MKYLVRFLATGCEQEEYLFEQLEALFSYVVLGIHRRKCNLLHLISLVPIHKRMMFQVRKYQRKSDFDYRMLVHRYLHSCALFR